jgi:DNA-binding HxlR family transcriptional regulator
MLPNSYADQNCSVARALEIVGERWTILIVRDALLGVRRFEDFQARLGLSRPTLSDRLTRLVEAGVLERVRYQTRPDRFEYLLTEDGERLWPVVAALWQWGEGRLQGSAPRRFRHATCQSLVHAEVRCPDCGEELQPTDVVSGPATGAPVSRLKWLSDDVREALSQERRLLEPVPSR